MLQDFQPLVSIVIPVYNGSNYMRDAIDSALAQTYKNIEIIVVNDGSTDNTDEIAKSYGDKIRYFSKENGGVSTALNLAIENMNGEYFSWLSHDDMYLPKKIESQINILKTLEDKKTIIYGGYKYIDEKGKSLDKVCLENEFSLDDLNKPLFALFLHKISGCTLLINRIHFQKIGLFDKKLKTTQDYDLWFKILNQNKIQYDAHCLTLSRIHKNQTGKMESQLVYNEESQLWKYMIESVSIKNLVETFTDYTALCKMLYVRFMDKPLVLTALTHKYTECVGFAKVVHRLAIQYFDLEETYSQLLNQSIKKRIKNLLTDIIKKIITKTILLNKSKNKRNSYEHPSP